MVSKRCGAVVPHAAHAGSSPAALNGTPGSAGQESYLTCKPPKKSPGIAAGAEAVSFRRRKKIQVELEHI
jgi:hypothetical protein